MDAVFSSCARSTRKGRRPGDDVKENIKGDKCEDYARHSFGCGSRLGLFDVGGRGRSGDIDFSIAYIHFGGRHGSEQCVAAG